MSQNKQKGFSLVEILIAVALLGAVSLGVMQIVKNMSNAQGNANSNLDILLLKHEILSLMNNERHCRLSLQGETFKKTQIDQFLTEGKNIEFWLSNINGTARSKKKFSGTDATATEHGKAVIVKLQLVMDNPTTPVGQNYPLGSFADTGVIKIETQKKGTSRNTISSIPISISFVTDATGTSTIEGCSSGASSNSASMNYLVMHSQSTSIPSCPSGWASESTGYSYLLSSFSSGYTSSEDLSDVGSCLSNFGAIVGIECENNQCDYNTGGDYSAWLWSGSGVSPSRCNICKKENTAIKVVHGQKAYSPPSCPSDMSLLWSGYSLLLLSMDSNRSASMRLGGSGSCLKNLAGGIPFIECTISGCQHVTPGDFATYLTTKVGDPDVGPQSPINPMQVSRCSVCQSN